MWRLLAGAVAGVALPPPEAPCGDLTGAAPVTTFEVLPGAVGDALPHGQFGTLEEARDAARPLLAANGSACILLREGRHMRTTPFMLGPMDGGRGSAGVVYASYPGERAVLDGGQLLQKWTEHTSGVWSSPLPEGLPVPRQVWIGGDRMNESGFTAASPAAPFRSFLSAQDTVVTSTGYLTNNSALIAAVLTQQALCATSTTPRLARTEQAARPHSKFRNVPVPWDPRCAKDVEFIFTTTRFAWEEDRLRVASWAVLPAETPTLQINFPPEGWARHQVSGRWYDKNYDFPTKILNLHAALTEAPPGSGYVSGATRQVFYKPRASESSTMGSVLASVPSFSGPLVSAVGDRGASRPRFVENLAFVGLTLRHASWDRPSGACGYVPRQSGFIFDCADDDDKGETPVISALELKTVRHVSVTRVAVEHVGTGGLAVDEGSDDVSISESFFWDTSCWGVRFGQANDSDAASDRRTTRLRLENSVLLGNGAEFRGCAAMMGGYFRESDIVGNNITDAQWGGITVGWGGWNGAIVTEALGRNRVLSNIVNRTNLACLDGGSIYTNGAQGAGQSEVAMNYVGYVYYKASLLYHDEGSSFWWTHDNVVDMPLSFIPTVCRNDFRCPAIGGKYNYFAAWASTEHDIVFERNTARGLNKTDVYQGGNISVFPTTLLDSHMPWTAPAQTIIDHAGARFDWSIVGCNCNRNSHVSLGMNVVNV